MTNFTERLAWHEEQRTAGQMSFRVVAWVLDHSEAKLSARLVLLVLAEYAHDDGTYAFPSVETIARKARIGKRAAQYALKSLREDGSIKVTGVHESGTSIYQVVMKPPDRPDGLSPVWGMQGVHPMQDFAPEPSETNRTDDSVTDQAQDQHPAKSAPLDPEDVTAIWDHYVAVMKPRSTQPGEDERKVIRKALKVATVAECCRAIDGCAASDFHMGRAEPHRYQGRPKKYNKLSQILRGRQGRETTRERIDFFLDLSDDAARGGKILTSGDAAYMSDKKRVVQRGWRFQDNPERVRAAEEAEAWLKEHGVEVVRQPDGYPTFRAARENS